MSEDILDAAVVAAAAEEMVTVPASVASSPKMVRVRDDRVGRRGCADWEYYSSHPQYSCYC